MKVVPTLLASLFLAAGAQAGSIGGPPPFTNGSPLTSGTNGTYQASVRGNNLSGVVTFAQTGGAPSATGNTYAVFFQGQVYTGTTSVTIMNTKISGILNNSGTVNGNTASGYFNANLDRDSAYGSFKGNGELETIQGTVTTEVESTSTRVVDGVTTDTTVTENTTNPVLAEDASFKIKGVRTSTGS